MRRVFGCITVWRVALAWLLAGWALPGLAADPPGGARPFVNAWRSLRITVDDLTAVSLAPGGAVGVVVGNSGMIMRTQDGGATWQPPPGGSGTTASLNAVSMANARIGVAVGWEGTIVRTQNGGMTWQPPPGGSGTTQHLKGVHMVDAQAGVVVGFNGIILRTQDGGATWQPPPGGSGTTQHLMSVHMVDAWTGVAVGTKGTILLTKDSVTPKHPLSTVALSCRSSR